MKNLMTRNYKELREIVQNYKNFSILLKKETPRNKIIDIILSKIINSKCCGSYEIFNREQAAISFVGSFLAIILMLKDICEFFYILTNNPFLRSILNLKSTFYISFIYIFSAIMTGIYYNYRKNKGNDSFIEKLFNGIGGYALILELIMGQINNSLKITKPMPSFMQFTFIIFFPVIILLLVKGIITTIVMESFKRNKK